MASRVLQQFNALDSREERLDTLQKLVQTLDCSERAAVISAISQKNDTVSALPLELVIGVFNNLHLLDAWILQRVCRRWRKLLSSEDFIRAALSRWDTHDPVDTSCSIESDARDSIEGRVRRIQALRLGRPFTIAVLENTGTGLQGPHPMLSHRKLDLKGDKIVYVSSKPGQGDTVIMHNLTNGVATTFRGVARERVMSTILTTSLVAFVSFAGLLYVAASSEPDKRPLQVQLPSSRIRGMGGHSHTVALVVGGDRHDSASVSEVLLYNSQTQRLRSFEVEAECKALEQNATKLNSCSILVDTINETVDVFSLVLDLGGIPGRTVNTSLKVTNLRVHFDGTTTSAGSWHDHIPFNTSVHPNFFNMMPASPTGVQNVFRIQVCELPFMGALPFRPKFSVLFDCERAQFVEDNFRSSPEPVPTSGMSNSAIAGSYELKPLNVVWKGITVRPFTCMDPLNHINGTEYHGVLRSLSESWLEYINLINDTFMVSLEVSMEFTQRSRIRIFCFDEHVHMAEAMDTGLWDRKQFGQVANLRT